MSSRTHRCTVCRRDGHMHPDKCKLGCSHWPPLCCPGCDCQSFEMAHPEKEKAL